MDSLSESIQRLVGSYILRQNFQRALDPQPVDGESLIKSWLNRNATASTTAPRPTVRLQVAAPPGRQAESDSQSAPGLPNALQLPEIARIAAQEYGDGTAENPGLHARRGHLGRILRHGADEHGNALLDAAGNLTGHGRFAKARLNNATQAVQDLQYRKARLYGLQSPPPEIATKLAEGQSATSPEGHVWERQDGVLYRVK